ncbi:FISUMP domain-containing protein [Mucilaginibacter phyllosphaerae]|uniref:Uncharacterized protein (TIGR02145 family) n=1 Tax=Mucilaginibacter phyllosphaerae TaxID=1812349 RepID=A0A4Y8AFX7_9SPHI|nr:FISUMP domain-containing protein [Mucilaginibacter phyllosphaerae]MBB3968704.1 uncharacterized protein (TIGR02145 family) [Mucilaginibacter phyllosphaerae]TEW67660.1 hypothetical protein E2R65_06625 [Mucilaginibacter phyllosphaerae]GGH14382.1 hypothetical protein GCM10007352_22460 [Mucilaginibacter phyllosphaerae]
MKQTFKIALLAVIGMISAACQKTVEYKQSQTVISNFNIPDKAYGDLDFNITAPKSNSTVPIKYKSSNSKVAVISGITISIKGVGTAIITAYQEASDKFTADSVKATFTVGAAIPTQSGFTVAAKLVTDAPFTLVAPASNSTGAFTYSSSNTAVATISGSTVTIKGAGNTEITATQQAAGMYASGSSKAILTVTDVKPATGSVTDVDGNVYHAIKIGSQTWMMENLKVTHYQDGSAIANITDSGQWRLLTTGAYCSYNNSAANAKTYGLLYNWYTVNDARKLAPKGWHIPTDAEWQALYSYIGGIRENGSQIREGGLTHWVAEANIKNETKFTGLGGGGAVFSSNGMFDDFGYYAYWWSGTQKTAANSSYIALYVKGYFMFNEGSKVYGLSVRCIKD